MVDGDGFTTTCRLSDPYIRPPNGCDSQQTHWGILHIRCARGAVFGFVLIALSWIHRPHRARNRVAALLQDLTSAASTSSTSSRTCYLNDTPPSVPLSDVPANPTSPSVTPSTSIPQPINPDPAPSDTHLLETCCASSPCGQSFSNVEDPSTQPPLLLSGAGPSDGSDGGGVSGDGVGRDVCSGIGDGSGTGDLVVAIEGGVGRVACHPGVTQLAGELECFAWVCVRDTITGKTLFGM